MTMSAVLYPGRHAHSSHSFVAQAMEVVRQNAPAQVMLEFCLLNHADLHRFEWRYRRWRKALRAYAASAHPDGEWWRGRGSRWLRATSRELLEFLEHHRIKTE